MKSVKFLSIAALLMIFVSCSKDDDNDNNDALSISFDVTTYKAAFYQAGESNSVIITSDIGDPDITLAEGTDPSVSYDLITQRVQWTHLLPLGDNVVTVVATVDSREATTDITIQNEFQGDFAGGNNNTDEMDLVDESLVSVLFNSDGTLTVEDDSSNQAEGTWSIDETNTVITFTITYNDVMGQPTFTYQGTLEHSTTELAGFWYDGEEVQEGTEQGYFRISLQK